MKTNEKPKYEPFPEIGRSIRSIRSINRFPKWQRSRPIVSAARISLTRPSKDSNDIDFIPTIFEDKKRRVRVSVVGSMRAERRVEERNRARKAMMRSQLRTIWLAVLGKTQTCCVCVCAWVWVCGCVCACAWVYLCMHVCVCLMCVCLALILE